MFVYSQSTGALWDVAGHLLTVGYSGFGEGKNNPLMQDKQGIGPIPQGGYTIGEPFDSEKEGPLVMRLMPDADTNTFGRDGFLVHGDSIDHPGCASHGCVILSRPARLVLSQSHDKRLYVQA